MNGKPTRWRGFPASSDASDAIVLFNAVLIGVLWIAVFWLARVDREETIRTAKSTNDNRAIAFEQYTIRTLEGADAVLQYLVREYARSGRQMNLARFAADYAVDNSMFAGLVLANTRGDAVSAAYAGAPVNWWNVSDREHFRVHAERDSGEAFIGKPVMVPTGRTVVPVTRRINRADGAFSGVAMVLIEPAQFINFLQDAKLRPHDVMTLVGMDGITRARLRGTSISSGNDVRKSPLFVEQASRPDGSYIADGHLDGVPKFFSYRTLANYPLITLVGVEKAHVLAGFHDRERGYYLAAGLTSAGIAGFTILLLMALAIQQRMAAAIAGSQSRFLATFNQAAVGIAHSDLAGRYLEVNRRLCDILGYEREELLGRSFAEFTHPDDVAANAAFRAQVAADPRKGGTAPREMRYIRRDGSMVWCLWTVSVVSDADGAADYLVIAVQDISDRKRAEKRLQETESRYRTIFETEPACVTVLGRDGCIREMNAAGQAILEADSMEQLRPRPFIGFVLPEYHVAFEDLFRRVLNGDSGVLVYELAGLKGRRLWLETHAAPLRDADGKVTDMLCITHDITERKRAEEVTRRYAMHLQSLSHRLMDVEEQERLRLGRELHDRAGSNLSALLMTLEVVRGQLSAVALEHVGPRLDDAEVLLRETMRHVRDVLSELRPPALDDLGLLAALHHYVRLLAQRTGLDILVEGREPSPRLLSGVEIALFRIAQEALSNATKHASATRIALTLRPEAGRVTLAVIDNGRGFEAAQLPSGTASLGMLTMRERAEAIGARLTVDSVRGRGTRVSVEMPTGPAGGHAAGEEVR